MFYQRSGNKYGAKRIEFNGRSYDSRFEAQVARDLDLRLKAKDVQAVEPQYRVEIWCYREDGSKAFKMSHKVDFRITHNDGSFELLEAKGVETIDYRWRRKFLENIWLPEHPDHKYIVIKKKDYR